MSNPNESNLQHHLTKVWTNHKYRARNPPVNTPHGVLTKDEEFEVETDAEMVAHQSPNEVSRITMHLSQTTNLGNYNSMRIQVGIDIPVPHVQLDSTIPLVHNFLHQALYQAHVAVGAPHTSAAEANEGKNNG